jgi:uncharacterized membrane protein YGL010W
VIPEEGVDEWADRYAALKYHGPGHPSAWLGVPLAIAGFVALLWSLPVPQALSKTSPPINWGMLFLMATFVYYCILSISIALAALPLLILLALPSALLAETTAIPLWPVAIAVFLPALSWQLAESKLGTGRIHALENLQYLMMGPVWLLRAAYVRVGLKY